MRPFVITTDSNADLPERYVDEYGMTIIPQYYAFGDTVYGDELLLPAAEFYQKMAGGELPTSMANNPDVIQRKFRALLEEGKDILHIAFSSKLSGSYNNVVMMANELLEEYPEAQITVIDSLTVSLGESILVMEAMAQKRRGKSLPQIASWLEEHKQNIKVQFTVDDLEHLQRGGRISKAASVVLGIVNIKPLLHVTEEGALASLTTVRGRKKSLATLTANLEKAYQEKGSSCGRAGIVHANCPDDAQLLGEQIKAKYPEAEIIINDISPSIGTHAGPGALGLCYFAE